MPFQGRTVQGVEKTQVGLDESQSIITLGLGQALDMDNFEIDISGTAQQRSGYTLQFTHTAINYFGTYFAIDGTQVFVVVTTDGKFWEAASPAGPWTDRTNGVVLTNNSGPWIGAELNGKFVLVNGTDPPVLHERNKGLSTLKDASLILPPQGLIVTNTGGTNPGVGSSVYDYVVTAITARGETTISNLAGIKINESVLTATIFNTIQWNGRSGAQGYNIYRYTNLKTYYQLVASVGGLTNSWVDNGAVTTQPGGPPSTNKAYNTPLAWESTPPATVATIARGRAQRMLISSKSNVWASAISDPTDWATGSNAFSFLIRGGRDNIIRAIVGLYDYTVLFSDTNAFVYYGTTYNDFTQVKMLNVGCKSPHSIIASGDEMWFWSDIGPNTLSRVMQGQDIQTYRPLSQPVVNTVNTLSNRAAWDRIVAWNDLRMLRVGWAYPVGTDTTNSKAILRTTTQQVWSRHSMPAIVNAVTDVNRNVYVATTTGLILRLYQGATDNGAQIPATYTTGWYDSQSNLLRYMIHLDVMIDKSVGNYSVQVDVFWDFSTTASSTHVLTQTTTDSVTVAIQTATANIHRCYVRGTGRYFQLKFTVASTASQVRILGWREEMYAKGRS